MVSITFKRPLIALAVIAGVLAAAGLASAQGRAGTTNITSDGQRTLGGIVYTGHAGLGAGYAAGSDGDIERVHIVTDNNNPGATGLKASSRAVL
jgi:hypothetical protein